MAKKDKENKTWDAVAQWKEDGEKTGVVYLNNDSHKCPYAEPDVTLIVNKKIQGAFKYLCNRIPHLEWFLYLIGERRDDKTIYVNDFEIYPQKATGGDVEWVDESGLRTSYIYEVKNKNPGKIVGNAHSHNSMAVFPSGTDVEYALVEGDFGIITNNTGEMKAWMRHKLPCGAFSLAEIKVMYETELIEEVSVDMNKIDCIPAWTKRSYDTSRPVTINEWDDSYGNGGDNIYSDDYAAIMGTENQENEDDEVDHSLTAKYRKLVNKRSKEWKKPKKNSKKKK